VVVTHAGALGALMGELLMNGGDDLSGNGPDRAGGDPAAGVPGSDVYSAGTFDTFSNAHGGDVHSGNKNNNLNRANRNTSIPLHTPNAAINVLTYHPEKLLIQKNPWRLDLWGDVGGYDRAVGGYDQAVAGGSEGSKLFGFLAETPVRLALSLGTVFCLGVGMGMMSRKNV
jgi:hypothetical protein